MIKIALVFPKKGFFEGAEKLFSKHKNIKYKFEGEEVEYILKEIETPKNKFDIEELRDYDVIISRGLTATLIKSYITEIPVIEILVSGTDVALAIKEAKEEYRQDKIAIIGSKNMIYDAEEISKVMDIDYKIYYRYDSDDLEKVVKNVLEDGYKVIVGGVETCEYAKKLKINTTLLKNGEEALWKAFSEAKKVIDIQLKEQSKTKQIETILDYTQEGIIEVDKNLYIITCNKKALKTLELKKDITGMHIKEVICDSELLNKICDEKSCIEEIVEYQDLKLMLNKVCLNVKDRRIGFILTFQDITKLKLLEQSIRKKLLSSGHIAKYYFEDMIGNSVVLKETIKKAKKYSLSDVDILLIGESGTGKELFAQSIHNYSLRKASPFIAINCAAINENLLESELFGYVEGAFTGAKKGGREGLFEQAHGGTIFLDEIGEISNNLQTKLLRVLQEREIMKIGDNKIIPIDVRIIAATNKDLFQYVLAEKFRADLYYRLNVLRLDIPSLQERIEDIEILSKYFLDKFCKKFNSEKEIKLTKEAIGYLKEICWYGNIRELQSICLRIVILSEKENKIDMEFLRRIVDVDRTKLKDCKEKELCSRESSEKEKIKKTMEKFNYNQTKTAEYLNISRSTLWKKLKKYNL